VTENTALTKSTRARVLGVSRSTLYYQKKQAAKDWQLKCQREEIPCKAKDSGHLRQLVAAHRTGISASHLGG